MIEDVSYLKQLLSKNDENGLANADLAPDGRYQVRTTTCAAVSAQVATTLARGFRGMRTEDFPLLIVGWGKCRVGSTALTNLFGVAGVPAFYQPVKTVARHVLVDGQGMPWTLPVEADVLFAKEMAGPYVHYETIFDPVGCLLSAGWPADRLHLLALDREPRASLNSWIAKWESKIGRERVRGNFELSSLNYARMRRLAREAGVAVTSFPYEASRTPEQSVEKLFNRLGLGNLYSDSILTNWGARGDLNSDSAMIFYPVEPEPYVVPGLHGSGDGYSYRTPTQNVLTELDERVVEDSRIKDAYATSVAEWADLTVEGAGDSATSARA